MNKISKQLQKIASIILSYRMKLNQSQKNSLLEYVETIKNNKNIDINTLNSFFYTLLTKGGLTPQELQKSYNSFSKQQRNKYEDYINKLFPLNNGAWAQINFNKSLSTKHNKTFNYYVNLQFKNKDDVNKFLGSLYKLIQSVESLSDSLKCYIGFKTHATLTTLLNHNDTLKFYWYDSDKNVQVKIKKLIDDYVNHFNLKRGNRLYDFGLDTEDNNKKKSFGQRCSQEITDIFVKWIKDNKNKYTSKQFVQSFEKNLESWIKSVAKKLSI